MTVNKKNYKVTWSFMNLLLGNSEHIVKLQMIWAGFATAIGSSTFAMSTSNMTTFVAIGAMFVDKILIGCLSIEEIPNKIDNGGNAS